MTSRLAPDAALLQALRARWEQILPGLAEGRWPRTWAGELRRMSDRFNRLEGAPKGDYFVAANLAPYLAHHGWIQAVSLACVAAECPDVFHRARQIWDLGAGPGPLTLAASLLAPHAAFTLADLREEALTFALASLRAVGAEVRTHRQRLPDLPEGSPDLVLLGHTLNELEPGDQEKLLARIQARLAPGGAVIILEPALMGPTRRLMELRAVFLRAPWSIAAPCPCPGPCPMLTLPKQWCVAELPWDPPPWFKALDEAAGLARRHLAFAYLVARRDAPAWRQTARIVGVPKPQKGKVERWVCTPTGGERWEALSRHGEPSWALGRTEEVPLPPDGDPLKDTEGGWKLRRWEPKS